MLKPIIALIGLMLYSLTHVFACGMPEVADIDEEFRLLDTYNQTLSKQKLSYEGVHVIQQNIEKVAEFSKSCIQQEDEKIKNINAINQELIHISNNQAIQKRLSGYDEDLCRYRSRKVLCQSLKLASQNTLKLSEDAITEYRNHISFSTPSFSESINLFKLGTLDFSHTTSIKQFLNLDFFSADQLKRLKVV